VVQIYGSGLAPLDSGTTRSAFRPSGGRRRPGHASAEDNVRGAAVAASQPGNSTRSHCSARPRRPRVKALPAGQRYIGIRAPPPVRGAVGVAVVVKNAAVDPSQLGHDRAVWRMTGNTLLSRTKRTRGSVAWASHSKLLRASGSVRRPRPRRRSDGHLHGRWTGQLLHLVFGRLPQPVQ
jgi:hypothetical protein